MTNFEDVKTAIENNKGFIKSDVLKDADNDKIIDGIENVLGASDATEMANKLANDLQIKEIINEIATKIKTDGAKKDASNYAVRLARYIKDAFNTRLNAGISYGGDCTNFSQTGLAAAVVLIEQYLTLQGKFTEKVDGVIDAANPCPSPATGLVNALLDQADEPAPKVKTDGKIDVKTDVKTDGKTDVKTDGKTDVKTDGKTDVKTDVKTDGKTDVKTDGKTDGKTDVKTDGKTDVKTDGKTDVKTDGKTDVITLKDIEEADNKVNKGLKLYDEKKWEESYNAFQEALEINPQNVVALYRTNEMEKSGKIDANSITNSPDTKTKAPVADPDVDKSGPIEKISSTQKGVEEEMRFENLKKIISTTVDHLVPPTDDTSFSFPKTQYTKIQEGSHNINQSLAQVFHPNKDTADKTTSYTDIGGYGDQIMDQIKKGASEGRIPSSIRIDASTKTATVQFDNHKLNGKEEISAWQKHIDIQYSLFTEQKAELNKLSYEQFINIADNLPVYEGLHDAQNSYKDAVNDLSVVDKKISEAERRAYELMENSAINRATIAKNPNPDKKAEATKTLTDNYIILYGERIVDTDLPGLGLSPGLAGEKGKAYVKERLEALGRTQSIQDELYGNPVEILDGKNTGLYAEKKTAEQLLADNKKSLEEAQQKDKIIKEEAVKQSAEANKQSLAQSKSANEIAKASIQTQIDVINLQIKNLEQERNDKIASKAFLTDPHFPQLGTKIQNKKQEKENLLIQQDNLFYRYHIQEQKDLYATQQVHEFALSLEKEEAKRLTEQKEEIDTKLNDATTKLQTLEQTYNNYQDTYTTADQDFKSQIVNEIQKIKNTTIPTLEQDKNNIASDIVANTQKQKEIQAHIDLDRQSSKTIQADMDRYELKSAINKNNKKIDENDATIVSYQSQETELIEEKNKQETSKKEKRSKDPYADTASENQKIAEIDATLAYNKEEITRLTAENKTMKDFNNSHENQLKALNDTYEKNLQEKLRLEEAVKNSTSYKPEAKVNQGSDLQDKSTIPSDKELIMNNPSSETLPISSELPEEVDPTNRDLTTAEQKEREIVKGKSDDEILDYFKKVTGDPNIKEGRIVVIIGDNSVEKTISDLKVGNTTMMPDRLRKGNDNKRYMRFQEKTATTNEDKAKDMIEELKKGRLSEEMKSILAQCGVSVDGEGEDYLDLTINGRKKRITINQTGKIYTILSYIQENTLPIGNLKEIKSITYNIAAGNRTILEATDKSNQAIYLEVPSSQNNEKDAEALIKKIPSILKQDGKEVAPSKEKMLGGKAYDDLSPTQKTLYDKYEKNSEALQKLEAIKIVDGQIEFTNAGLAIQDTNALPNKITKEGAEQEVKKMGNKWRLPKDKDSRKNDTKRLSLDPENSDYDKMISQMPGANDNEKVENFRLLTGMDGGYWTGTSYRKSNSESVTRRFLKDQRDRDENAHDGYYSVRLVRPL